MSSASPMAHDEARELLPWLVNGTLRETERDRVREHAASCVICRSELEELERLQSALRQAETAQPVPPPDMRRINARIDAQLEQERGRERIAAAISAFLRSPWRIAFVAQSIALASLLAILLWPPPDSAQFTTLTEPDSLPAGAYIRVVFDPGLGSADIAAIADSHSLEIVKGPSERGVATLGHRSTAGTPGRNRTLDRLREQPGVLFAEPVRSAEP